MKILRTNMNMARPITIFAITAILCMTGIASAVTYHGTETISSNTIWADGVHVINASCHVTVSDNVELTIPAGAVVKFNSGAYMYILGTLNATGTPAEKIVFTSIADDTHGGDTNGDGGATSPAPGDWGYIRCNGYSSYDGIGIFDHCIVRYGGSHATYSANVYSDRSDSFSFRNSVSEHSQRNGIRSYCGSPVITNSTFHNNSDDGLYSNQGSPTVTNNSFTNNTDYAAYLTGVTITSYRGNSVSGNGKNGLGVTGTVSSSKTWGTSFPYVILNAGVTVNDDIEGRGSAR